MEHWRRRAPGFAASLALARRLLGATRFNARLGHARGLQQCSVSNYPAGLHDTSGPPEEIKSPQASASAPAAAMQTTERCPLRKRLRHCVVSPRASAMGGANPGEWLRQGQPPHRRAPPCCPHPCGVRAQRACRELALHLMRRRAIQADCTGASSVRAIV